MNTMYDPSIFNVPDMLTAMRVILTPEDGLSTRNRWERETPYLTDLILNKVPLNENSRVLDFGCGIGRISKELIKRTGCLAVGADISANMRGMSMTYVNDERWIVCHPSNIPQFDYDLAISIWVLQHVEDPEKEVLRLSKHAQKLFVVNEETSPRVLPSKHGWYSDDKEIPLERYFTLVEKGTLDPSIVSEHASKRTSWALYVKK